MTYRAREVLSDCRLALQMLEEEQDLRRWRLLWAGAVALLRAVGHVLDKADGQEARVKSVASQMFKLWKSKAPEHEIFREFIDKERNSILKEYEINVHPLVEVPILLQGVFQSIDGARKETTISDVLQIGENIYRPILDGPWKGDDARDVLSEAIDWWESQLSIIDDMVAKSPPTNRKR